MFTIEAEFYPDGMIVPFAFPAPPDFYKKLGGDVFTGGWTKNDFIIHVLARFPNASVRFVPMS